MSGHSKWHSIKHKKAAIDGKRGKIFTRIIREVTIAAKMGGGDQTGNPRLRKAVSDAKDVNMPWKNIENAIKKGTGEIEGAIYEEVTYEGYGPGGVAILVDGTTDNRNRTVAEIKHIFSKNHGVMGAVGSVGYLFRKVGQIHIARDGADEDRLMETALDAGAEDVQVEDEGFTVLTPPHALLEVREKLQAAKFAILQAEVANLPETTKAVDGKDAEDVLKLISALEDNDDVQSVSSNHDIPDEILERFH